MTVPFVMTCFWVSVGYIYMCNWVLVAGFLTNCIQTRSTQRMFFPQVDVSIKKKLVTVTATSYQFWNSQPLTNPLSCFRLREIEYDRSLWIIIFCDSFRDFTAFHCAYYFSKWKKMTNVHKLKEFLSIFLQEIIWKQL